MTQNEFMEALSELNKPWVLLEFGIRYEYELKFRDEFLAYEFVCPLAAVALDRFPTKLADGLDFETAADLLGMEKSLANKIADAADGRGVHHRNLRMELFNACGLNKGVRF